MKAYTDIEQSKKLSTFLPIESADAYYFGVDDYPNSQIHYHELIMGKIDKDDMVDFGHIPAWSLSALLNILPKVEGFKPIIDLDINLIRYEGSFRDTLVADNDELVDAVVEIIIKLHEQKLL